MSKEADVLAFLQKKGKATLAEVAKAFGIPRYGPESAWTLLEALRGRGQVGKKGDSWIPVGRPVEVARGEKPKKPARREPLAELRPEVQAMIEAMARTFATAMKGAEVLPSDEWALAEKPMETEIKEDREKELASYVAIPDLTVEAAKKELVGFPTETFIDNLFLTPDGKPLGGIPICGQFAITGLPGSGKSILAEEIAVKVAAKGKKVLFVTAEDTWKSPTPRFDLQSRLVQKAQILGLSWGKIAKNLFIMDTVACPELRDWTSFAETYRYIIEREGIELVIIDSVTILEAYRGALKYRVMELCRFNQVHGVTGLYVNQRSSETWDSYDMAGGIGLAHNLDGTIIVDYGRVYWFDQQTDLGLKRGEFARIARVLDCRLSNFERRRLRIDITPDGFIRPVEVLPEEVVQRGRERKGEAFEEEG